MNKPWWPILTPSTYYIRYLRARPGCATHTFGSTWLWLCARLKCSFINRAVWTFSTAHLTQVAQLSPLLAWWSFKFCWWTAWPTPWRTSTITAATSNTMKCYRRWWRTSYVPTYWKTGAKIGGSSNLSSISLCCCSIAEISTKNCSCWQSAAESWSGEALPSKPVGKLHSTWVCIGCRIM